MMRALAKLQTIDVRWLYLVTIIVLLIPFIVHIPVPTRKTPGNGKPSPAAEAFRIIESCPDDKVIIVDASSDQGSAAENRWEFEVLIKHLVAKRKKFLLTSLGVTPFGPDFGDMIARPICKEGGLVEGEDWAQFGYIPGPPAGAQTGGFGIIFEQYCRNPRGVYPIDRHGKPVDELPIMQKVRDYNDMHAFVCITYQPNNEWMSVVSGMFNKPMIVCCMSIAAPSFYQYLDSGQLAGALFGNRGTAEYEALLGVKDGWATKLTMAGSFGNCAILIGTLIGNIGWWAARASVEDPAVNDSIYNVYTVWVGAIVTLTVLSYLVKNNPVYRIVQHAALGVAVALSAVRLWVDVLWPRWLAPIHNGGLTVFGDTWHYFFGGPVAGASQDWQGLLWLIALIPGILWYFQLSRKYYSLSTLVSGLFIGAAAGLAIKYQTTLIVPQVQGAIRPLNPFDSTGAFTWESCTTFLNNALMLAILFTSLLYFFFSIRTEHAAFRAPLRFGRLAIMTCLGAMFGSTVLTRVAYLLERMLFLYRDWFQGRLLPLIGLGS